MYNSKIFGGRTPDSPLQGEGKGGWEEWKRAEGWGAEGMGREEGKGERKG
jgi:hypothetical protein